MASATRFVGATVETLLDYTSAPTEGTDIVTAAEDFLAALTPIGDPFEIPWKLEESLDVLQQWLPDDLVERLLNPGTTPPVNHVEASVLALAREAGVQLEPLTKADMDRLRYGARRATEANTWGRQSSHPWDTVIEAELDSSWFFAFCTSA